LDPNYWLEHRFTRKMFDEMQYILKIIIKGTIEILYFNKKCYHTFKVPY